MNQQLTDYYRDLHHRTAMAALNSLMLTRPHYDRQVIVIEAIAVADTFIEELMKNDSSSGESGPDA